MLMPDSPAPQIGHLHPECAKDIVVTLKSDLPISLKKLVVKCKISKILFQLPTDQVPDWDDRMRTVKWVDTPRTTPGVFTTKCKVRSTHHLLSCLLSSGLPFPSAMGRRMSPSHSTFVPSDKPTPRPAACQMSMSSHSTFGGAFVSISSTL